MAEYVQVATLDQLPPGTGVTVSVADTNVALFNVGGSVYALNDSCKHAGASLGSGSSTARWFGAVRTAGITA